MNFFRLFNDNIEINATSLSWALGNINSYNTGYIPQPAQVEAVKYQNKLQLLGLTSGNTAHICASFYHLLNGTDDFPLGLLLHKRQAQGDFDRMSIALKMVDALYGRWNREDLWEQLKLQIKYSVKEHLLELVQLPQIGKVRAERLYKAGIKTKQDFLNKPHIAKGIVTNNLYEKIRNLINI